MSEELVAQILAEAELAHDDVVAAKYGVSRQSILKYRRDAATNSILLRKIAEKRRILEAQWAKDATKTIVSGLTELQKRYINASSKDDAACLSAIAFSIKVVGELKIGWEVISDDSADNKQD